MRRNDTERRREPAERPTILNLLMILLVLLTIFALSWLLLVGPLSPWLSIKSA